MCTTVGFYASFDSKRTFLKGLLAKIVKKYVSSRIVDSSKDNLSSCTNNKEKLGFLTPSELQGETVEGL